MYLIKVKNKEEKYDTKSRKYKKEDRYRALKGQLKT